MEDARPAPCDVFISGDGPVGSALALALSRQGLRVAIRGLTACARSSVAPVPRDGLAAAGAWQGEPSRPGQDPRAYALNAASVDLLGELRVWEALPADARTPVHDMWVHGDEASTLRFSAWQQRIPALAFIVDAAALQQALHAAIGFAPHVRRVISEPPSALRVLAEGRDASAPAALGAQVQRHDYAQRAVAARLICERPHAGLARQWFRSPDVLALLPLDRPEPGSSFALVWSLPEERAQSLLDSDEPAFEQAMA